MAGGEIAMQSPHPQQQLALQHDQGAPPAPDVQASRRELLLQPSHVKDELQEQSGAYLQVDAGAEASGEARALKGSRLQGSEQTGVLSPGGAIAGNSDASDKPSTPALARIEQSGRPRGLAGTSVSRLAATSAPPPALQPAGAPGTEHPVPPLLLHTALGDTPRGTPVALSPYTGSGVMASGFRLPNPSRLKGTSAKVVLPEMPPPQAGGPPGTSSLGGWSPVSAPPVAGAGSGGQTSRLVSDLAAVAGAHSHPGVGADGNAATDDRNRGHTTLYLSPATGPAPAEQRLPGGHPLPMLPPLAREPGVDLPHGARAAGHRARQPLGPAAGRPAGRQWVSESLPAIPVRSLSHEGETPPLSPSVRASVARPVPDDDTSVLPRGKQQPLGNLLRSLGGGGSAPQPHHNLPGGPAASKQSGNAAQPGRRRPAWGESNHYVGNGGSRAYAAMASPPAAGRSTSAGDAVGGSLLSDLPDIVALLSQDPAPQRTGPIRIEKIDI